MTASSTCQACGATFHGIPAGTLYKHPCPDDARDPQDYGDILHDLTYHHPCTGSTVPTVQAETPPAATPAPDTDVPPHDAVHLRRRPLDQRLDYLAMSILKCADQIEKTHPAVHTGLIGSVLALRAEAEQARQNASRTVSYRDSHDVVGELAPPEHDDATPDRDTRLGDAVQLIIDSRHIQGAHHLRWVLDQILRALTGDDYGQLTAPIDSWDEGIAP